MTSVSPSFSVPTAEAVILPEREPPTLREDCILHGNPPAGNVTVIMSQRAVQVVHTHGQSDMTKELGGALLGEVYAHDGQTIVEVKTALVAHSEDNSAVHFTFSADVWAQINRDKIERHPELEIVGWFHTHPDLGVFFSADDVVVHSAAFTQPWHIGLVTDPVRDEANYFGWRGPEIVPIAGFYEHCTDQQATIVPWRVNRSTWSAGMEGSYPPMLAQQMFASEDLKPISSRGAFLLAGMTALFGLIALLIAVLPLYNRVNVLESAYVTQSEQLLAGANDEGSAVCSTDGLRLYNPLLTRSYAVGDPIEIIGTANIQGARIYQLKADSALLESSIIIKEFRRGDVLAKLATWDTTDLPAGQYTLSLNALDRSRIPLESVAPCSLTLTLYLQ